MWSKSAHLTGTIHLAREMKVWLHRAAWHVLSPVILSWTHRLSHLLCRDVLRPLLCLTTTLLLNMALSSTFASITNPFLSSLWEFIFATYFPQLLVWTPVCWSALSCWLFMSVSPIPLNKKKNQQQQKKQLMLPGLYGKYFSCEPPHWLPPDPFWQTELWTRFIPSEPSGS